MFILVIRSVTDVLPAQSRFVKFGGGGGEAADVCLKYVSNRPYNKFITPITFI